VLLYLPSACITLFSFNSGITSSFRSIPSRSAGTARWPPTTPCWKRPEQLPRRFRRGERGDRDRRARRLRPGALQAQGRQDDHRPQHHAAADPSIILGISLLVLLRVIGVGNSLIAITIGHVIFCTPLSVSIMISRLSISTGRWRKRPSISAPRKSPRSCRSPCRSRLGDRQRLHPLFPDLVRRVRDRLLPLRHKEHAAALYLGQLRFPQKLPEILALGSCVLVGSLIW